MENLPAIAILIVAVIFWCTVALVVWNIFVGILKAFGRAIGMGVAETKKES